MQTNSRWVQHTGKTLTRSPASTVLCPAVLYHILRFCLVCATAASWFSMPTLLLQVKALQHQAGLQICSKHKAILLETCWQAWSFRAARTASVKAFAQYYRCTLQTTNSVRQSDVLQSNSHLCAASIMSSVVLLAMCSQGVTTGQLLCKLQPFLDVG